MDDLRLEVLNNKKKEILKQLVDFEFRAKLNKSSEILNNGTVKVIKQQLAAIDELISEYNTKIEK